MTDGLNIEALSPNLDDMVRNTEGLLQVNAVAVDPAQALAWINLNMARYKERLKNVSFSTQQIMWHNIAVCGESDHTDCTPIPSVYVQLQGELIFDDES